MRGRYLDSLYIPRRSSRDCVRLFPELIYAVLFFILSLKLCNDHLIDFICILPIKVSNFGFMAKSCVKVYAKSLLVIEDFENIAHLLAALSSHLKK